MIQKILLPVDGSPNSAVAVDFGIYIAPRLEAALVGLHVIDIELIQGPMMPDLAATVGLAPCDGCFEAVETSLKEKAAMVAKNFADRCKAAGIAFETLTTVGRIGDAIIEAAATADMILMARKGEHFHLKEGSLIGSVAENVIRHSGKPVLVIPETFREIESMALAYDGSAPARKALELSLNLSEKARWPITVLIISADASRAAALTHEVEDRAQQGVADCEVVISSGKEPDDILQFIREGAVELMVMGAYGHNRLREWLVGSTTSHIIARSSIPVLLTR